MLSSDRVGRRRPTDEALPMRICMMSGSTANLSLTPTIRVALVEDNPAQGEALLALLSCCPDLHVLGFYSDAEQAIEALPALHPDVVLVDIGLPQRSGIDLVSTLKERLAGTQFLMLTVMDRPEQVFAALSAGASGYLLKKNARERLGEAVREAHAGGMPLSVSVARLVLAHFQEKRPAPAHPALTGRELEVLDSLAQGLTYKEVGERLHIALGTVQTHVERIYEKLHVRSRLEALRKTGRA